MATTRQRAGLLLLVVGCAGEGASSPDAAAPTVVEPVSGKRIKYLHWT